MSPSRTSRKSDLNQALFSVESQPQDTYKRFKVAVSDFFRRSRHGQTTSQIPAVNNSAVSIQHDGRGQQAFADLDNPILGTFHHRLPSFADMQAEDGNKAANISNHVAVPLATQFQSAQAVNISGHPRFTNIGNMVMNNYGGTHGMEKLEAFVSFAALHDSAEQDPSRCCHPGTRKNVLSQLRDWIDDPNTNHPIFWLYGPAGAGKSAIAQTIARAYENGEVAATFFFYRSDPSRNNGNRLFPTIAWQLAFSISAIKEYINHVLEKAPHLPRKDVETQFKLLVVHPFQSVNNNVSQMPHPAPVVIIDGLDECSDEQLQRRILAIIGNAVKDCLVPLRFLICSRPEALIEEALDQFKDITLRIDLASLDDSHRDIEKYLTDQFSEIRSKHGLTHTWPGHAIIEDFVFKSSGNFILAATVMRYISDEDCDPEEQLDIILNLKPSGKISPFALLDELYMEILKRQRDQDFLKTFLALLVGRSSFPNYDLYKDDATLMNVSEKNLCMKLRRMRPLLKFEPFVDVHHKSFLDFLQDPSRSGEYYISNGQKQYLELIVGYVVRHISMAFERHDDLEDCHCRPEFESFVKGHPPKINLSLEDWQEALKPLLDLQGRLLNSLMLRPCYVTRVMRALLLHLAVLRGDFRYIPSAQTLESNVNKIVTEQSLMAEVGQYIHGDDLDKCLSLLLSCLQQTESALVPDTVLIDRMSSLLAFDCTEILARVQSVTDAQILIDIIDLLNSNKTLLNQCGQEAALKAALLASEIFARVPLLPRSIFLDRPIQQHNWFRDCGIWPDLEVCLYLSSPPFDHVHVQESLNANAWWIHEGNKVKFVIGNVDGQNESIGEWLERSNPDFITRTQVMLALARTFRYIHSMAAVVLVHSKSIESLDCFTLDSNQYPRFMLGGLFAWHVKEALIPEDGDWSDNSHLTAESNVFAFAKLFDLVCFRDNNENACNDLAEDARRLVGRCRLENPQSRPTMDDVVKEMETWDIT